MNNYRRNPFGVDESVIKFVKYTISRISAALDIPQSDIQCSFKTKYLLQFSIEPTKDNLEENLKELLFHVPDLHFEKKSSSSTFFLNTMELLTDTFDLISAESPLYTKDGVLFLKDKFPLIQLEEDGGYTIYPNGVASTMRLNNAFFSSLGSKPTDLEDIYNFILFSTLPQARYIRRRQRWSKN